MSNYSDDQIINWVRYNMFKVNPFYYMDMGMVKIPQVFPSKIDKLIFNPSINTMTAELIEQIEMFWEE